MARFELRAGDTRVEIDPALGGGVADFSIRSPLGDWTPILRRAPSPATRSEDLACFTMLPWPNRIRDAEMLWSGRRFRLGADIADGSAIHGRVRERAWRIRHRTPQSAVLEFDSRENAEWDFPWPCLGRIRYEVSPDGLEVDLSVTNTGTDASPFGLGLHPYFMRRLWADEDALMLRFNASGRYPVRGALPTGAAAQDDLCRTFAEGATPPAGLDDLFTLDRFDAHLAWPGAGVSVRFTADEAVNHAALYTPAAPNGGPASWLCFEPMTMATDAVNLEARGVPGVSFRVLDPSATLTTRCTLEVRRV